MRVYSVAGTNAKTTPEKVNLRNIKKNDLYDNTQSINSISIPQTNIKLNFSPRKEVEELTFEEYKIQSENTIKNLKKQLNSNEAWKEINRLMNEVIC